VTAPVGQNKVVGGNSEMIKKVGAPKFVAYTVKNKSYRGDNSIQVRVRSSEHPTRFTAMFNLYRRQFGRLGLYYFNDRYGNDPPFRTITEAKAFALKAYLNLLH